MESIDLRPIVEKVLRVLDTHKVADGHYRRWIRQDERGTRDLGVTAYGCADAANILYTLGRFPKGAREREAFVAALQSFQNEQTGLFHEDTHIPTHTTAHCTAALELFDALPLYPFFDLARFRDAGVMRELLEGLDWVDKKGPGHIAPAIYSCFVIEKSVDLAWRRAYFDWLNAACDPGTGLWRKGYFRSSLPLYQHMADGFHFYFTYEHAHEPFPCPEALIDVCLAMVEKGEMPENFGRRFHFVEIDWVYCLSRASRQTPHRFFEVREALSRFAKDYAAYLTELDWDADDGANDLHLLFGTVDCFAELQSALPGQLLSEVPLRQVLDRRPFI